MTAMSIEMQQKPMEGRIKAGLVLIGFTIVLNLLGLLTAFVVNSESAESSTRAITISLVFALLNAGLFWMVINRNYTLAGALGIIFQFIQSGILQNASTAGSGYLWGLTILVVGSALSVLLFDKKLIRWGILASNILGFMAMEIDFLGAKSRQIADLKATSASIIFVAFFLIFTLVVILRQWRNLDIGAKMLLSFIAAGGIVAIAVQFTLVAVREEFARTLAAAGTDPATIQIILFNNQQGLHSVSWLGLLLAGILSLMIAKEMVDPLVIIANGLQKLALGDLNRDVPQEVKNIIMARGDEIGMAGKGIGSAEIYMIEMAEVAHKIANGDLTVSVTPRGPKDELGLAFSKMISNLKRQVGEVAQNATLVQEASHLLSLASNQAGDATNQIAGTMQQVARGAAQQTESISKTAAAADQMSRAINGVAKGAQEQARAVSKTAVLTDQITSAIRQVSASAENSVQHASQAAETARSGARTVQETIEGMQTIKKKVDLSIGKVREMGSRSSQISVIVETIEDIASQTNLLALNAAIEAARVGENGNGFAVVADEVRKLAERASTSTKEINLLIKGIQQTVAEAVAAMDESGSEVELGVKRASQSDLALKQILKAAETVNLQVADIAKAAQSVNQSSSALISSMDSVSAVVEENTAATEEMFAGANEVSQAIETIASVGEEYNAAVEEVSASTEEMSAQVQEVAASAQTLSDLANALQHVVTQFKLPKRS